MPAHDPPTITIIGRIDEARYKGHGHLIRIWPNIVNHVPKARLLIVGKGPGLDDLRREAENGPVSGNIEFAGFVPEEQMPRIWERTTVFAMPSLGEGFGLVYVEAMRYGVPVIASIHDAAVEVNEHGVSGYNVDLNHREDLLNRLLELLTDRALRDRLGQQAQARWRKHFRYSSFRERFLTIAGKFVGVELSADRESKTV